MKIGIIGAGHLGASLARLFVTAGHEVALSNSRGPQTIGDLALGMGATATTVAAAVGQADLIAISIPQAAIPTLPDGLFDRVPGNVPVIDTGNYYPGLRDAPIEAIEQGLPESLWVSQQLGRPVVKAFNSISFTSLAGGGRPSGDDARIALPVAGDEPAAKALVLRLMDEIGFDGLDAGPLSQSWRQQPGTPAYCTDLDLTRLAKAIDLADKTRAPALRDQFIAEMIPALRAGEKIDLIALGRAIYGAP